MSQKNTQNKRALPVGSIVALVTPFDKYGKVDCKKIKRLVSWHKASGTAGVVVFGTTGESPTLTQEEKQAVLESALQEAQGEIFVFAGSGSNDTAKAQRMAKDFCKIGADGLLVVSPYYNKTNDFGMTEHFLRVADASCKPILAYNVPSRTGCSISFEVLQKISTHPNIAGIKEASGNLSYAVKVAQLVNENFALYCGNDDSILPFLALGALGVISVWANVMPYAVAQLVSCWQEGKTQQAREIQLRYLDFINLLFVEPNPIPVKTALNILGFDVGLPRLPLGKLCKKNKVLLHRVLKELGEIYD